LQIFFLSSVLGISIFHGYTRDNLIAPYQQKSSSYHAVAGALFVELVDVPEECLVAEGGATWQNSYRCGGVCNILIGDAYMHLSQCLFNHQAASQQTTIAMTASESPSAEHKVNVLFVCLGNICKHETPGPHLGTRI
jgi:hypothetical protein